MRLHHSFLQAWGPIFVKVTLKIGLCNIMLLCKWEEIWGALFWGQVFKRFGSFRLIRTEIFDLKLDLFRSQLFSDGNVI